MIIYRNAYFLYIMYTIRTYRRDRHYMFLLKWFEKMGEHGLYYMNQAGRMGIFLFNVVLSVFRPPYYKIFNITKQIYVTLAHSRYLSLSSPVPLPAWCSGFRDIQR